MSGDLKTQVRDYTEFFMGTVESIDLEEIKERPLRIDEGPVPPLASPSRHRGWLVGVAGAAVVLVLGLLTFLTRQTTPEAPAVSQPSPSPTVTTPGPVPSTPIRVDRWTGAGLLGCEIPSGWVQVCGPASFDEAAMYAVTAGGPGLVAVGANGLDYSTREDDATPWDNGANDAVVWTSPDGLTWTRVPHNVVTFGGDGGQQMFAVTAGGPGLVAVGRDGAVADREGHAAVWTSPDGFTWSRVPHDEAIFGGEGEQRMVSVTVGGPGLVAVGFDRPAEVGEGDAAVWTSPDGFTWTRVPHNEAVFGGESRQMMLSVTTGGPGLVAVGTDGDYGGRPLGEPEGDESAVDAAVWTSPDGFTWSRVTHDESIFGGPGAQRMASVTAGGPGLVAVGSVTGDLTDLHPLQRHHFDAAVWTSPDGFTWSRVPHDDAVFSSSNESIPSDAEEVMLSVTAGGPGLVAVVLDGVDDCGWDSAVWTSPDGFTWSRVPDARICNGPYDRMLSVTVGPFGLVAVGEEHYPGAAAVWNG